MKRHVITKTAGLATLALLLLGASIAMANITTANTTDITETAAGRFRIIPIELPEIHVNNTTTFQCLVNRTIEKLLAEETAFLKETRPLIYELKSKWAALTDELVKQSPEKTETARLQNEISALDTRLAEVRLDHLMALNDIKTTAAD